MTGQSPNTPHRKSTVRDWVLYALIAIAIVAMIAALAVHDAHAGTHRKLPLKWLGFFGTTATVFGYAIRDCRGLWKMRKFWLLLSLVVVAQIAIGVCILAAVDDVPLLWFGFLGGVEYAVLTTYLPRFLDSN
jgi:peptidoglycan/LPS O-acetylase OafA/YrhL